MLFGLQSLAWRCNTTALTDLLVVLSSEELRVVDVTGTLTYLICVMVLDMLRTTEVNH